MVTGEEAKPLLLFLIRPEGIAFKAQFPTNKMQRRNDDNVAAGLCLSRGNSLLSTHWRPVALLMYVHMSHQMRFADNREGKVYWQGEDANVERGRRRRFGQDRHN